MAPRPRDSEATSMAAATQRTRTIEILAGAPIRSEQYGVETTIHCNLTVEATLTTDRWAARWVYELNGRTYSVGITSADFRWV